MKDAAKFGIICFGLQLGFLVVAYKLFPEIYPGDSFMIVFFYVVNLLIAAIIFPLLFFFLRHTNLQKNGSLIVCFILMLLIINTTSMKLIGKPYTIYLLKEIVSDSKAKISCLFEFFDPLISFMIAGLFTKRSI